MDSILTSPGSFVVGCNYWASHAGTNMWRDWQPDVVEADLRQLAENGLQVLRVFPLWPDFQPLTVLRGGHGQRREYRFGEDPLPDTEAGRAGVDEVMLARFEALADLAEKYGLKLIVGLLTGWMSGRLYVPPAFEGLNVLTDPEAVQWQVRFVRHVARRMRHHPALAAWDLGNEVNVMAPVRSPAEMYAWVAAITGAIRREDPAGADGGGGRGLPGGQPGGLPIVSGLHGDINLWQPALLGELCDLLTTHPYPVWTAHCDQDPVNTIRTILHAAAETRLYADLGCQPALAEEVGTLGPMLGSDDVAADFVRANLFSLWAADCHGLLWWCAYDQGHLAHAPYDWNTCERELGLIRADRGVKPALVELGRFRRWLDGLPLAGRQLPARPQEAGCLRTQDQDHWAVAYSAYILAEQAGFSLRFVKAEDLNVDELGECPLYLMPSLRGVNVIPRRRWLALLEKVRAGAALYLSMDDALLSEFREVTGLEIITRSRRTEPTRMVFEDFTLEVPAPFRLAVRAVGAEVLAREGARANEAGGQDAGHNPVFTRHAYGSGQVYYCAAPIERCLTETPGAFQGPTAQPFWRVYEILGERILAGRAARKTHPMTGLSEHPLEDGRRVVVAVNYSPEGVEEQIRLAAGWRVDEVWYGTVGEAGEVSIPANDAVVLVVA